MRWFLRTLPLFVGVASASCLTVVDASFGVETKDTDGEAYPQACYDGPQGTADIGICRSGVRQSAEGGCEGQVLPREDCDFDKVDADCDGTTGAFRWNTPFHGYNTQRITDIAVFKDGSVAIIGWSWGNFEAKAGEDPLPVGTFVARIDPKGIVAWAKSFDASGAGIGQSIVVDSYGDVVLTGYLASPTTFGGDVLTPPPDKKRDFVAKLDGETGEHRWSQFCGSSTTVAECRVAAGSDGKLVITGAFQKQLLWPNGGGIDGDPEAHLFVSVLNSSGDHLASYKSSAYAHPRRIAVDKDEHILILGIVEENRVIDFGGGEWLPGDISSFLLKLDAAGQHVWSHKLGTSTQHDYGRGLAVQPGGTVAVVVPYYGILKGPAQQQIADELDIGFSVFSSAGKLLSSQTFGGDANDSPWALAATTDGGWVMGGTFQGTLDIGTCAAPAGVQYDGFLLRLDPAGNPLWARRFGDPASDDGQVDEGWPQDIVAAVAVAPDGDVILGGMWNGSVSWGDSVFDATSTGDMVVARFAP